MSRFRFPLLAVAAPLALALVASPAFGMWWGLDVIDQSYLPLDNTYSPRGTGSSYTVWVIGTGIDPTLPEFGGRAQQVANYAGGPNEDTNGHGTWVASLVGGRDYGVAKAVQLRGIKVIDECGHASPNAIVNGINYIIANGGSNSVAVFPFAFERTPAIDNAIASLVAAGVPVAVAAGDEPTDACNLSPAGEPTAFTVGAHDMALTRPSWQAYGSCIDIYAPGEDVTAAWPFGEGTRTLSSTAASAAMVAGGIVLHGGSTNAVILAATRMGNLLRLFVG